MNIIIFTRLFGNIFNTYLYTYSLALLLRNYYYYYYYYFTVLTSIKLFITNSKYTYTSIYQYHCNVIIHETGYYLVLCLIRNLFIYLKALPYSIPY